MYKYRSIPWLLLAVAGFVTSGCEKAETIIVEKDPIVDDDHDHDHDDEHASHGRLLVLNAADGEAAVFDLEENSLLDSFALSGAPTAGYATGGFRYGALVDRAGDSVQFIDGGVWQEDHVDHLHDYEEAAVLLDYSLTGSRPTHITRHDGQIAVFYDGDAATSTPASVTVFTDADITSAEPELPSIAFETNQHGVAEPRGEHLLVSWRRADEDSTSANPILPDQVAVYHWHDGEYEQEQILDVNCPDLHGAAQNEYFLIFGCSDGVLLAHADEDTFDAEKIANSDDVAEGLRIGSIYGHEHSEQFIGLASAHGGSSVQWFAIDPEEGEMELIDWQPMAGATIAAAGFAFEAEQFLILDSLGYLTAIEPHEHDGHVHWEFGVRLDISEEDLADMPEGLGFAMTLAENGHFAYVADPIAQHILVIDLELMEVIGDIELDFAASAIAWLGIAEAHEH